MKLNLYIVIIVSLTAIVVATPKQQNSHKCSYGELSCSRKCTKIQTDVHNCGKCGHDCGHLGKCVEGKCTCSYGTPSTNHLAEYLYTDFDNFSTATHPGAQNGWVSSPAYDYAIVTSPYPSFGSKSLRMSNAVTSGGFDQLYAKPLINSAGEPTALTATFNPGKRYRFFELQFDIASDKPTTFQSGLRVDVSPDRGDGARMSFLKFEDVAAGIQVTFNDVQGATNPAGFTDTVIGTFSRNSLLKVKLVMEFRNGPTKTIPANDIVKVYINCKLVHTGTSWENYYRFDPESQGEGIGTRIVKTVLFHTRKNPTPALSGGGFLFDNVLFGVRN